MYNLKNIQLIIDKKTNICKTEYKTLKQIRIERWFNPTTSPFQDMLLDNVCWTASQHSLGTSLATVSGFSWNCCVLCRQHWNTNRNIYKRSVYYWCTESMGLKRFERRQHSSEAPVLFLSNKGSSLKMLLKPRFPYIGRSPILIYISTGTFKLGSAEFIPNNYIIIYIYSV